MAYVLARRQRTSERWPVKKMDNPLPPSPRYTPGGTSYANIAGPRLRSFGPSGNFNSSKRLAPSGKTHHSGGNGPSGSFESRQEFNPDHFDPSGKHDETPFSVEELTAMTFDVINSLKDVRRLPSFRTYRLVRGDG